MGENKIDILWRNNIIGQFLELSNDDNYLKGEWISDNSELSIEFQEMTRNFNIEEVKNDSSKGTRVILNFRNGPSYGLVFGMEDRYLIVRKIIKDDEIKSLLDNVK